MTQDPLPDRVTNPDGYEPHSSVRGQNLFSGFFDFKRENQKNQHSAGTAANTLERNGNMKFVVFGRLMMAHSCAIILLSRNGDEA